MYSWIDGLLSVLLDRSTEELFAAVLLALALAGAGSYVGRWISRSKREEQVARMTGVLLIVILASMAIAGAYIEMHHQEQEHPPIARYRPPMYPTFPPGYFQYVTVLDLDGDGIVDHRELHEAAVALGTVDRSFPGPHPSSSSPQFTHFRHDPDGRDQDNSPQSSYVAQELQKPANAPWGSPTTSR